MSYHPPPPILYYSTIITFFFIFYSSFAHKKFYIFGYLSQRYIYHLIIQNYINFKHFIFLDFLKENISSKYNKSDHIYIYILFNILCFNAYIFKNSMCGKSCIYIYGSVGESARGVLYRITKNERFIYMDIHTYIWENQLLL